MELHIVSTGRQSLEVWHRLNKQIYPYADYIHIREKNWSEKEMSRAVMRMLEDGIPAEKIVINGVPRLTEAFSLGGTHFPERCSINAFQRKEWRIGSSVHSVKAAEQKVEDGADYLFFGHIYNTNSKKGTPPRGLEALRQVAESVSCPVIAIGGITPERVKDCLVHKATGVAVMSGVYEARDPVERIIAYQEALKGGRK